MGGLVGYVLGQGRAGLAIYVLAWRGARRGGLFQHGSGFMGWWSK